MKFIYYITHSFASVTHENDFSFASYTHKIYRYRINSNVAFMRKRIYKYNLKIYNI